MVNLDADAGLHRRRAGASRARPGRSPARSRPACVTRTATTSRRASAPRGAASPGTILRGGYGISLQRRLVLDDRAPARRPAAVLPSTSTSLGTSLDPLLAERPFVDRDADDETNNYGVDRLRARPGADVERRPVARPRAGLERRRRVHRHARHRASTCVRAPNRGPDGLRIDGRPAVHVADLRRRRRCCTPALPLARRPVAGHRRQRRRTRSPSRATTRRRIGGGATSSRRTIRTSTPSGRSRASTGATSSRPNVSSSCRSARTGVAERRRHLGRDARELARSTRTSPGSRARRSRRGPGAAADVARGTNGTLRADYTGAADPDRRPDDRSVLQHRRVLDARCRRRSATPRAT